MVKEFDNEKKWCSSVKLLYFICTHGVTIDQLRTRMRSLFCTPPIIKIVHPSVFLALNKDKGSEDLHVDGMTYF